MLSGRSIRGVMRGGVLAGGMALGVAAAIPRASAFADDPVVFSDNFERDEIGGWTLTDAPAWKITKIEPSGNRVLDLTRPAKYEPPVRSPFGIALAKDVDVSDFVLDVNVKSTTRDYPHRDLCVIFGYQDPSHYYYVHLGKAADEHANSIFIVNGEPRVSIAKTRTTGTPWTDDWHKVRVVRKPKDGLIEIYFDDMSKPAMTAEDKTFAHGGIGLGSFDDAGMFDDITVKGVSVASSKPAN